MCGLWFICNHLPPRCPTVRLNQQCIQVWQGVFNAAGDRSSVHTMVIIIRLIYWLTGSLRGSASQFSVWLTLNSSSACPIRPDKQATSGTQVILTWKLNFWYQKQNNFSHICVSLTLSLFALNQLSTPGQFMLSAHLLIASCHNESPHLICQIYTFCLRTPSASLTRGGGKHLFQICVGGGDD